eukprot:g1824.t1
MSEEFSWSSSVQGHLHAAFFCGLAGFQFLGGYIADLKGGKGVVWLGLVGLVITLVTVPFCCEVDRGDYPYMLFINRLVMGVSEGVLDASIYSLLSQWFPKTERSRVVSIVNNGALIVAVILAFVVAPFVQSMVGWRLLWYGTGCLLGIWCLLFPWMQQAHWSHSRKELHPRELALLERGCKENYSNIPRQSWRKLFQRKSVFAVGIGQFAYDWTLNMLVSWLPTYMHKDKGLTIFTSMIICSFPLLCMLVAALLVGVLADKLYNNSVLSLLRLRKTSSFIGLFIPGLILLLVPMLNLPLPRYSSTDRFTHDVENLPLEELAIFTLALIFLTANVSGFFSSPLDLSAKWSGSIKAYASVFGCVGAFASTSAMGYFIDEYNSNGYDYMFIASACVLILGAFLYSTLIEVKEIEQ